MSALLEIRNVETYYDLIYALRGVSLTIETGRITTILGNNGAGKSTILKTVMGLIDDQPDKGEIHFAGQRIDGRDTEWIMRRGISFVPEGREVFEELSVRENLLLGAYTRRDRRAIQADMEWIFGLFPVLKERTHQWAGTLSGGEQQMLAIGRALMSRPKMLLLDEPSLGLSPLLVKEIFAIIETINAKGVTILLVEQNARMALSVAHEGLILENGRFVLQGSSATLQADKNVQEFYLGMHSEAAVKGYQRWKRKRAWR
ncbi:MAG: ABC transporter ATP-binding protein [Desulfosarcinaceae bacterium]|nr:ABC transporter ATP-binding protein [Desulfosarcinaceae bacterium]